LAFINLTTAEAVLCQIADSQTYVKTLHKLHVFEPSEILFPRVTNALQKSKLLQVLEASVDVVAPVYAIARKYWDEVDGAQQIETLAFKEDVQAVKVSVDHSFYASCCFAAVRASPFVPWSLL
jgi:DNA mismatch repair protein MSH4